MTPKVSLVIVSHSPKLAEGVRDLAGQMAPGVGIFVAGGMPDGTLGSSFEKVEKALEEAAKCAGGCGVAILTDLGSTTMTVESVLEILDSKDQYVYVDAPLVEGAVAAAVAAEQGEPLSQVAVAAEEAGAIWGQHLADPDVSEALDGPADTQSPPLPQKTVTLVDHEGLHARPAAKLAQMAARYDATITIDGANASSVLQLMTLGRKKGETVTISAAGAEAEKAVTQIADALATGLDSI